MCSLFHVSLVSRRVSLVRACPPFARIILISLIRCYAALSLFTRDPLPVASFKSSPTLSPLIDRGKFIVLPVEEVRRASRSFCHKFRARFRVARPRQVARGETLSFERVAKDWPYVIFERSLMSLWGHLDRVRMPDQDRCIQDALYSEHYVL